MTIAKFLLWTCALLTMSGEVVAGKTFVCSPEASVQLESAVSKLDAWQEVYASFRFNAACNTKSVVEVWTAYSQTVARLFANHREKSMDFFRLASQHNDFKYFVIEHLQD